ncbi:MAG: hypothetical protein IKT85_02590 [Kiritimatiellae bacterium]|nr:hypothetical protein [Kiritimatiellia bacterium]
MKGLALLTVLVMAGYCFGYCVSVGTFVANEGCTVTVPIELDSAEGLSYAGATLAYDPQVLVVTKVEAGTLNMLMPEDFISSGTNGLVFVSMFGSAEENVKGGSGSIAKVTFAVREGCAGRYSDITISNVELGEKTGVKDVTIENPLSIVHGMVRVMSETAGVTRLESAQTVNADTRLGTLTLIEGDNLQASDKQTPIVVTGDVRGLTTIPVVEPVNGWASGCYALLSTPTTGLQFVLEGVDDVIFSEATENGVTTYYATLTMPHEIPVVAEGETLATGTQNQIRTLLGNQLTGVTKIMISGPQGLIGLIADMGIAPSTTLEGDVLKATYARPEIRITSFEPQTGLIRIKVTPGVGNTIVSEIETGYIHVYGTDDLSKQMSLIERVGYDLTPYLEETTKGEVVLNVTLGTHTFVKVKVENLDQ